MKIAIKGHALRGKEVIQILETLGGKNNFSLEGNNQHDYYGIYENNIIILFNLREYKLYTLEEFKKEFPFKIGDKVIDYEGDTAVITGFTYIEEKLGYFLQYEHGRGTATPRILKPYKEMKEKRNITLTLDKAKEWYQKGGELREVALQAYSEKELVKVELPKTWEEFCANYPIQAGEAIIDEQTSQIRKYNGLVARGLINDKNVCSSQRSAEAHLAMIQLEQLRDCYNDNSDAWGWSYSIIKRNGIPELVRGCDHDTFLRFNNEAIAVQFLKCFRDLIEKAGDLI